MQLLKNRTGVGTWKFAMRNVLKKTPELFNIKQKLQAFLRKILLQFLKISKMKNGRASIQQEDSSLEFP